MSDGPVLLVTGASSGIGAATARAAAEAGYRVALAAAGRCRSAAWPASSAGPTGHWRCPAT